ncbi:MAG: OB-fold domain-containing protein [Microthrixaceae bacterium]
MAARVPLVDYLVLGERPHLVAHECVTCGARFFDHRNACAACGAASRDGEGRPDGFRDVELPTRGELTAFTIVSFAAPGVPVPFVAGVVDCGGTSVRANVVGVEADPEHVELGMELELTTFPIGVDGRGTEAVGFGFAPAGVRT